MNWPIAADKAGIAHAAELLRNGGLVAFPTETYYGLAVDPFNRQSLERLFFVKRRPRQFPILVLIDEPGQLTLLTDSVPAVYRRLIDRFWPGPLTLVCPSSPSLLPELTGNTGTIGVRWSPHETANALVRAFGGPITATSANLTGFPAAISAGDVARMFDDVIDLILDGGTTPGGSGSTLIGFDHGRIRCIREGKIPFTTVQDYLHRHER